METRVHFLKTHQGVYVEMMAGKKTFDIRKNDRDFRIGDYLYLQETREFPTEGLNEYTGNEMLVSVSFLLDGKQAEKYGLKLYYCAMSTIKMNTEVLIAVKSQMYKWDDKLAILFSCDEGTAIVNELIRNWLPDDWKEYIAESKYSESEKAIIILIRQAEQWYTIENIKGKGMNLFDQTEAFKKWLWSSNDLE